MVASCSSSTTASLAGHCSQAEQSLEGGDRGAAPVVAEDERPPLAELLGRLPPGEAIARAYRDDDYRMREIVGALGCHSSTVSRRLRAFEERWVS